MKMMFGGRIRACVLTGMGSYMDTGDQPSTWATWVIMTAARAGEEMKCNVVGRKRGVSVRSSGVICLLGVRN